MRVALGKHYLVELYGCDPELISYRDKVEAVLLEAARIAKAHIVKYDFHNFSPTGVSGMIIISESHFSIHTWPEHSYAAVDIFTCSETVNERAAIDYMSRSFKAKRIEVCELRRGVLAEIKNIVNEKKMVVLCSSDKKINQHRH
jgi:S-adenosylmethionine decarboxylase